MVLTKPCSPFGNEREWRERKIERLIVPVARVDQHAIHIEQYGLNAVFLRAETFLDHAKRFVDGARGHAGSILIRPPRRQRRAPLRLLPPALRAASRSQ